MIIDLQEKYDVDPQWFEQQVRRDPAEAWIGRLCELLSVYSVSDPDGAKEAAERMKTIIGNDEKLNAAME